MRDNATWGRVSFPHVSLFQGGAMKRVAIFLLSAELIAGCEKKPEPDGSQVAENTASTAVVQNVVHDIVAVRIDGRDFTRRDVIECGKTVLQLNLNKARRTKIRKREINALERYCRSAVGREIAKAAVARYVSDRGLKVSREAIRRATRKFESKYGAKSRRLKRMHNIDDLKYMLGKNAFRADEMVMEMALFEVMTNDVVQNVKIQVTDDMVSNRIEQIKMANDRAAATNALVFAKATNVWRKVASGKTAFEKAASDFSEDEYIKDGCEWGTFTRDQLEGEEAVLSLLPSLKPGDVTPPVESDGGVAILRKEEDDSDKTFSFSRIFFRLPYFYDQETPDEARAVLKEMKKAETIQSAIKDSVAKLNIEYPDGTNIVWKITPKDLK